MKTSVMHQETLAALRESVASGRPLAEVEAEIESGNARLIDVFQASGLSPEAAKIAAQENPRAQLWRSGYTPAPHAIDQLQEAARTGGDVGPLSEAESRLVATFRRLGWNGPEAAARGRRPA